MRRLTREDVIEHFSRVGLDEFDLEDLVLVLDQMLESHTPLEIMSWASFYDTDLQATPIDFIQQGQTRLVVACARKMIEARCRP